MTDVPTQGQRVTFVGGTGRGETEPLIGIVNGDAISEGPFSPVFVPVHIPETNQNVMVDTRNVRAVA